MFSGQRFAILAMFYTPPPPYKSQHFTGLTRGGGSSDTKADFLDKSFDSKKDAVKRANKALQGDDEYKSNMADDEHSVCGSERVCDKKSVKEAISPPLPLLPFSP